MFRKITAFFIPAPKLETGDELRSERIFVAVLLISALSNFLGINLALDIDADLNGYLLLINGLVNLLILLAYRAGLSKPISAILFLSQFAISFPIQAWLQGGLVSPAAAAFFLLPAIAMLILGKRAALFWMVISALLSLGLFLLESTQGTPVPQYNVEKKELFYFSSILGTNITIFIILLVYELGKSRAFKNIQEKNEALMNTQEQLIQQEKLASLGQLTAGIAHEIKNPLNFILNFSEVNSELVEELQENLHSGRTEDNVALLKDIQVNLKKIHDHGSRADSIVKSMLKHSREGGGKMELTDFNALIKEYVNLSFHGMRAGKDPINVSIDLDLDPNINTLLINAEDFSRVILNLCNNAFDAMRQKLKENPKNFQAKLKIRTLNTKNRLNFEVEDNGPGIPKPILDKILQPFFTTKKGTEGTGLGLSISHDIIKSHGGKLTVSSILDQRTIFKIELPARAHE
ncbi:ATP-binding protein [Algoriphagus sp.]|uniref:sensor histidine kinase n=1 Tax=Algoriphagus sp. TaxID=1872435 RepID=UPI002625F46D|nr:ATP-binding protein [Algoriphagus sp.]